jgi:hypothetical protein
VDVGEPIRVLEDFTEHRFRLVEFALGVVLSSEEKQLLQTFVHRAERNIMAASAPITTAPSRKMSTRVALDDKRRRCGIYARVAGKPVER